MQELAEGQMFARYRILYALGSSPVGESYAAEDTLLERTVTLKVTHPWPALPNSARYQFFREMQDIGLIIHSQLAAILDCGDFRGRLYIARNYVEGGSLLGDVGRAHFRPPLPPFTAIHYATQLAEALQHLHSNGYIHGALTFSNVLVTDTPDTLDSHAASPFLIADAGFTYFAQHTGQLQTPLLPATAAPEQWHHHYSPACDQYALGVLLYFWLAGRLPFLGRPQEVLRQKQFEAPPSLVALNPNISREQEAVLRRALDARPERRYPSMLAFASALQATLPAGEQRSLSHGTSDASETTVLSLDLLKDMFAASERAKAQAQAQAVTNEPEEITPPEPAPTPSKFESLLASIMEPPKEMPAPEPPPPPPAPTPPEPTPTDALSLLAYLAASSKSQVDSINEGDRPSPFEPQPRIEPDIAQPIPPAEPEPTLPPLEPSTEPQPQEPPARPVEPTPPQPPEPSIPVEPQPQPTRPKPEPTRPQPRRPELPTEPQTEPLEPSRPETLPRPEPDIAQPIPTPPLTPPPGIQPGEESEQKSREQEETATAYLVITSPYEDEPYEVILEPVDILTIGRAGSSNILLDQDNLTSRHHALLKYIEGQFVLYDQRSAKGVFVNGRKLISGVGCPLRDGDNINIGRYKLAFHHTPSGVTTSQHQAAPERV